MRRKARIEATFEEEAVAPTEPAWKRRPVIETEAVIEPSPVPIRTAKSTMYAQGVLGIILIAASMASGFSFARNTQDQTAAGTVHNSSGQLTFGLFLLLVILTALGFAIFYARKVAQLAKGARPRAMAVEWVLFAIGLLGIGVRVNVFSGLMLLTSVLALVALTRPEAKDAFPKSEKPQGPAPLGPRSSDSAHSYRR